MDSGWNFGEVPRSGDELPGDNAGAATSAEDRSRAISGSNNNDGDQEMDDGIVPELSHLATSTTSNDVTSTEPAQALTTPVPDNMPAQTPELDNNPAPHEDAERNPDDSEADRDDNVDNVDSGDSDGDGNDDGDGAQDNGNNAAPQQPVNWAPAGIDNMDPNWVHSNDAIAESYDCKICTDAPAEADRVFLECGHVFCADCLNQSFRHALTSRANFPPRCCRNNSINFDIAQYHLEDDTMVLVLQNWEEWSAPDPTYCQTLGCTGGMIFDHFVIDQWAHCKTCDKRTCTECKASESAHESPDKHPNPLSDEDAELVKKEGWKQCPKCRKVIERIDGCDHMQCIACSTDFCYRCGGNLENGMGCNCQGQNPWVQGVQADIDGAQNDGNRVVDGDDDSDSDKDDDGNDADAVDGHDAGQGGVDGDVAFPQQNWAETGAAVARGWGDADIPQPADNWGLDDTLIAPGVPQPPAQPETMTVAFAQMTSRRATLEILGGENWAPDAHPRRNPTTGALEWVFNRIEPQAENTDGNPEAAAGS